LTAGCGDVKRHSPRGRAQTWTEDPTPRLFNQEFRSRRGRRAILTQSKRNWDPKPDRPRADTGAAVVPVLASASRSQSGYIWMAEQAPSRAPAAAPPRGRAGTGSGHTHWVLARIPEQHQHLVSDVDKGGIGDLFVKVYGLAARDPKQTALQGHQNKDEGPPTPFPKLQPGPLRDCPPSGCG
jgi:hypothetical protein